MVGPSSGSPTQRRSGGTGPGTGRLMALGAAERAPQHAGGLGTGHAGGRDLKTARAVLRVLRLLEQRDEVDAVEVAAALGKSTATATYLLNSLVAEGFAERDPAGAPGRFRSSRLVPGTTPVAGMPSPALLAELEGAVRELYGRTGERSYLAFFDQDLIVVADSVGRQGLARIPGLDPVIRREAHCLAIGKVVLAELGLGEWARRSGLDTLPRFTASSITDPERLEGELDMVRRSGYAVDRGEFSEAICCVAAPVRDGQGMLVGTLGVSVPASRFPAVQERLVRSVCSVSAQVGTGRAVEAAARHEPVVSGEVVEGPEGRLGRHGQQGQLGQPGRQGRQGHEGRQGRSGSRDGTGDDRRR